MKNIKTSSTKKVLDDWECDRGFFRVKNECNKIILPPNGKLDYLGTNWDCVHGYYRVENECKKVVMPPNAKLDYLGTSWDCVRGYYRVKNECKKIVLPPSAKLDYLGNDWECVSGFKRNENLCVKMTNSELLQEKQLLDKIKKAKENEYKIEHSINDEVFIINGDNFEARTYCYGFDKGDRVKFLDSSPLSCVSAKIINLDDNTICEVWCK